MAKKERRTPPPTMESIVHKAKAKKGEAEYKRSTDPDELKKKTTQKRPPKEKKMPAKVSLLAPHSMPFFSFRCLIVELMRLPSRRLSFSANASFI